MKKISLILVIAWLFVIFLFSREKAPQSNHTSDRVTIAIVKIIDKVRGVNTSSKEIDKLVIKVRPIVRKSAHITEYLILGILIFNLVVKFSINKTYMMAFILCVSLAVLDECHQLFISGRTGRVFDVFVDSFGIILGLVICYLFNLRFNKKVVNKYK